MPYTEDRFNRAVAEVRAEITSDDWPHGPCINCSLGRCPWTARWEAATRLADDAYSAAEWADADGDTDYAAYLRSDGDWWTSAAETIAAESRAVIASRADADEPTLRYCRTCGAMYPEPGSCPRCGPVEQAVEAVEVAA